MEGEPGMADPLAGLGLQDMITSMPGIDEAMGFAEVMKYPREEEKEKEKEKWLFVLLFLRQIRQVKSMEYSVIIFDTAPTGHTLRFLSFPAALQKGFSKIFSLKSKFGGLFSQVIYVCSVAPHIFLFVHIYNDIYFLFFSI